MDEQQVIDRLRRIATHEAARGLNDDAAVLDELVITHDSIAEGIHFLTTDPPASVGWKLVAVNLSDLAAKGAEPAAALLSLTIAGPGEWEMEFLNGLEAACESYGLPLVGGDTIALPEGAPRVLGMTAIGRASGRVPDRAGGEADDALWLIGTLGDSAAGLAQLRDDPKATGLLVDVYHRPVPQVAAGQVIASHAHAMMDVSDGLLLDALRMARASGLAAVIALDALPLSEAFVERLGGDSGARMFAATAGDDYALLAALAPGFDPSTLSLPPGTTVARIGRLEPGAPQVRLTHEGEPVELPEKLGFEHQGHDHRDNPAPPMADRP